MFCIGCIKIIKLLIKMIIFKVYVYVYKNINVLFWEKKVNGILKICYKCIEF